MSIYRCIDSLEKKSLTLKNGSLKEFFNQLLTLLKKREQSSSYENLDIEISLIKSYSKYQDDKILKEILDDLNKINDNYNRLKRLGRGNAHKGIITEGNYCSSYNNLQEFEPYKIAVVMQGQTHFDGNDSGNCYGYGFAMVDPNLALILTQ